MDSVDKPTKKSTKPKAAVANPFVSLKEAERKIAIQKNPESIKKVSKYRIDAISKAIMKAAENKTDEIKFVMFPDDDDYEYLDAIVSFLKDAKWEKKEPERGQNLSTHTFKSVCAKTKKKDKDEENN